MKYHQKVCEYERVSVRVCVRVGDNERVSLSVSECENESVCMCSRELEGV